MRTEQEICKQIEWYMTEREKYRTPDPNRFEEMNVIIRTLQWVLSRG